MKLSAPASLTGLALAPLLGGTGRAIDGLALGLAALLILGGSRLAWRLTAPRLAARGVFALTLAVAVTLASVADLLLHAWAYPLAATLSPWVAALALPGAAQALPPAEPGNAGWRPVAGFALLAPLLGLLREALGQGTLLAGTGWLTSLDETGIALPFPGLPLAGLAPGALLLLGLALAVKNVWKP